MHITDRSDEVIAEMHSKIETALDGVGFLAEGNAKALVPVDTGHLRDSITHLVDDNAVTIGTVVEYAAAVELGHAQEVGRYVPAIKARLVNPQVPPQPFLGPAIADHLQEYRELIYNTLKS